MRSPDVQDSVLGVRSRQNPTRSTTKIHLIHESINDPAVAVRLPLENVLCDMLGVPTDVNLRHSSTSPQTTRRHTDSAVQGCTIRPLTPPPLDCPDRAEVRYGAVSVDGPQTSDLSPTPLNPRT
eukprot:366176-Chlamydomonas_euryale.AAC.3